MNRGLVPVSALFLGLFGDALAQDTTIYVMRDTATRRLRVRSEARADASSFECINPGAQVMVLGVAPYWRKVHLPDGRKGWVARKFIEPVTAPAPNFTSAVNHSDAWLEVDFVDIKHGDGIWDRTYPVGDRIQGVLVPLVWIVAARFSHARSCFSVV